MKSMLRLIATLAALISFPATTLAQQTQDEEAEAECVQICQAFPTQAPPGCTCALVSPLGTGGSGKASSIIDLADLSAGELIDVVRAAEAERMAGINDYWLIEYSNIAPVPTIRYYERTTGGAGRFRLVPPAELQARWYETAPNLTAEEREIGVAVSEDPAAMAEAMGQAFAIAAPGIGKELPIGGGAVTGKMGEIASELFKAADGLREDAEQIEAQGDDLQQLADALQPLFKGPDSHAMKGIYVPYKQDGIAHRYYVDRKAWEENYPEPALASEERVYRDHSAWLEVANDKSGWPQIGHGAKACIVATFLGAREIEGGFTVEEAELWLMFADATVPVFLRMVVRQGTRRVVIERETTRWGWDKTKQLYRAHVVREYVRGVAAEIPRVMKRIEDGGVNSGPPSPMDQARITGGNIGVPGADPTGSEKP